MIGQENLDVMQGTFRSLSLLPLTRRLGMSITEVNQLFNEAKVEAISPGLKAYFPLLADVPRIFDMH